jgi:hypothetical protein
MVDVLVLVILAGLATSLAVVKYCLKRSAGIR